MLLARQLLPRWASRRALDRRKNRLRFVAGLDQKALGKVLFGVVERIENHALDLLVGQSVRRLHFNLRRQPAALFPSRYLQNAVGVDQEVDLDARQSGAHGRNASQVEACQRAAVRGQFALALNHVNGHVGLPVHAGGEVFGGRGGNGRVALDDARHCAAQRLDPQRKRGHVEQKHGLGALRGSGQNVGLHRRAQRHHLVGIQLDVRLLAPRLQMKEIVHQLAHGGNPCGPAHQHHFIDLFRRNAGVGQSPLAGPRRALQHRLDKQLEDRAGNLPLVAVAIGQLDVEVRNRLCRKLYLGVDGGPAQPLHRAWTAAQIHAVLGVNFIQRYGQQQVVDVVAAQVRVAVCGLHLEDAVAQFEDRNVERAAAQVINGNGAHFRAVQSVGQSGCGGLVDQPQHLQPGHAARVFGCLPLRIVEVGGHGNDGLRHRRAEEPLGVALELAQDVGRYLRRREFELAQTDARHFAWLHVLGQPERKQLQLVLNLFEVPAHQPLHGVNDPLRRFDERLARRVAHGNRRLAAPGRDGVQRHHRRHQVRAVHAGNHHRRIALHISNQGVGGSQVDSDYASFRHAVLSSSQGLGNVANQIAEIAAPVEQS